ncbi:MAG: tRNA (adenosine(37)-N6)-dimethylallyltransferase MiaA [Bacteroidetes bacterium]|nr:tRNA (adenosine(37)-N6)-dimethylallyltransferase MiaA [Bacteroidota bacterium]MBS1930635.1 tRNA (adenosine(37)-N6)-dimethylallyltransferase MiaA [Bacteroidota bacterium]
MAISLNKTVVIIVGPTAVGKTAIAIELAKHFNTDIISADSRQCFKELKIGVARPSEKELKEVKHYFIASHSIHDEMNAAVFEKFALKIIDEIFITHDIAVMAGGTGLYIKAFCEGLHDIPNVDPEIRKKIISSYSRNGLEWLQNEVKEKDSEFYQKGEMKNPQRLMRALVVKESTGNSILSYRKGESVKRDFNIVKIGLALPKDELHRNINSRVDTMMNNGLLDEVKSLISFKNLNALHTVGYSELFEYLDHRISLDEAIERIKKNTRQYAKRQLTWFRKDKTIQWFSPKQKEMLESYAEKKCFLK